jgi:SAM-dependent methyltransferase
MTWPDLPSPALARMQSEWLATARSRLLRRVQIATRRSVLELGAGYGTVAGELQRRSGGRAIGLDRRLSALANSEWPADVARVCADAQQLPFADRSFDLVYCQWTFLWLENPGPAASEVARVLQPDGVLVAIEPDFGGLIEYPPALGARELWLDALGRAGADPRIGRRLPGVLSDAGFEVQVDLSDRLEPPSPRRLEILEELPLSDDERARLTAVRQAEAELPAQGKVVHLPMFLVTARRRG